MVPYCFDGSPSDMSLYIDEIKWEQRHRITTALTET